MDIEQELASLAESYKNQGYDVTLRPGPDQLPAFAKDFRVEILGKRGAGGVLVSVKQTGADVAADANLPRYAEVANAQPGWRFDLAVLEGEGPLGRRELDLKDFSGEDIERALAEAEQVARHGFVRPAVVAAWAALESAMRMRLRATGEDAGWGESPRGMMNELYSSGVLLKDDFRHLENLFHVRNQIAHGFSSPRTQSDALNPGTVNLLSTIARRLVRESQPARQPV